MKNFCLQKHEFSNLLKIKNQVINNFLIIFFMVPIKFNVNCILRKKLKVFAVVYQNDDCEV